MTCYAAPYLYAPIGSSRLRPGRGLHPVDCCYVRDDDFAEWVEAGWLRPYDDVPGGMKLLFTRLSTVERKAHAQAKNQSTAQCGALS